MKIYTDGSTAPSNPGPGGFGVVVCNNKDEIIFYYSSFEPHTTNNIQEMKAILYALKNYGKKIEDEFLVDIPTVYTDSSYALNTFNTWMFGWEAKGWVKSDGKSPENLDLIKQYYDLWQQGYRIDLVKVKGHNGNFGNELADKLAKGKDIINDIKGKTAENFISGCYVAFDN